MHVRNVRADGDMDSHGDALFVGGHHYAQLRVFWLHDPASEVLPGGFPVSHANPVSQLGDFVDAPSGFLRHAELALTDGRFHILGSVADHGDFKIMDEGSSIHGDAGNVALFHQVDEHRRESYLNDVTPDAPQNGSLSFARNMDG